MVVSMVDSYTKELCNVSDDEDLYSSEEDLSDTDSEDADWQIAAV